MRLVGPPVTPPQPTVNGLLAGAAARAQRLTFVRANEPDQQLDFTQVYARARRAAAKLRSLGLRPNDRFAVILPTGLSFLDAFFGGVLGGFVPVPLYPPMRLGRLEEYHRATAAMMTAAGARLLVTDRRCSRFLGQTVEQARPALGMVDAEALVADPAEHETDVDPSQLAFVQFSSGSTGDQKPVALTHHNLTTQVAAIRAGVPDPGRPEVCVSWVPLYHDLGLVGALLGSLALPTDLVLIPPDHFLARPALWLDAVSRFKGTVSPTANFALSLLTARIAEKDLTGLDLSSWDAVLIGAEPVSPAAVETFHARLAPYGLRAEALRPVYGLAEASLTVSFAARGAPLRTVACDREALAAGVLRPGDLRVPSCGTPAAGMSIEVRDEEGQPTGSDAVGRIWIRGPSVMSEYLGNPEATRRTVVEGWLDTGDLGFISGGELFVTGRAKDVICLNGANHVPHEFEECVSALPDVRTGCVVALGAVPSDAAGEQLFLFAESATDLSAEAQEALKTLIQRTVVDHTGLRPHSVVLLPRGTLPRTSSGKFRRRETLRRYLARELVPPPPMGRLRLGLALLKSKWAYTRGRLSAGR